MSRLRPRRFVREPIRPTVSLIISALNEEAAIRAKVENSLALDYPRDRLEIVVASDGSTDRTDAIVRGFADRGVRLHRFDGGLGKSEVLNRTAALASGEILAFSDATGMWSRNAIAAMAAHYADPRVGCVSGRVGYRYHDSPASRGFGIYQRYILALRRAEAAFGAGFNASGSIHSIRKSVFRPGPPDTFMDMVDPLHAAMQGYRTTFEDSAVSMEESRSRTTDEFRARLRIALRSWRFFAYALPRLPVFRSPMYCFQVISHKLLRWCVGPSLPVIFLLNLALLDRDAIYRWLFAGQIAYYGLTILGIFLGQIGSRLPALSALVFFNSTNLAYLTSFLRYLRGERMRRWVPSR
ncbi:MAG: glycosyltransferase [Candidatus Rokubacteria bacterium]|nr:glycosyltransferase [Candidatus Rokubacteria bacterium]